MAISGDFEDEANIERRDLFGFIRNTLRVAAMHSLELEQFLPDCLYYFARLIDLLFECLFYFVFLHIAGLYVYTLYLGLSDFNLEFLISCLMQIIIYVWSVFAQLYFRHMQPKVMHEMINILNLKYRTRSAKGLTYVTMDECLAKTKRLAKPFVYCGYLGAGFWLLFPIIYQDKSLPLNCQYPFDVKQPVVYEIFFILQSFGQIQMAAAFGAASGLFMVSAILISGQYDLLNCSLKNIVATAYIQSGATPTDLRELKKLHHLADLEQNQYYVAKEIECDLEELSQGTSRLIENDIPAALKAALKECIAHHRYIIAALKKMEDFYNPIWFFKVGEVTLVLCLMAFISVKSSVTSSFVRSFSMAQYVTLLLWDFLNICYFAETIYLNSQRCGEALLRSPWHLHMKDMRSDFLFFLLNSKRHFQLTAGKLTNLNVDCFRSTVTTAFSVFTLLQKMDARHKATE